MSKYIRTLSKLPNDLETTLPQGQSLLAHSLFLHYLNISQRHKNILQKNINKTFSSINQWRPSHTHEIKDAVWTIKLAEQGHKIPLMYPVLNTHTENWGIYCHHTKTNIIRSRGQKNVVIEIWEESGIREGDNSIGETPFILYHL